MLHQLELNSHTDFQTSRSKRNSESKENVNKAPQNIKIIAGIFRGIKKEYY